MTAVVCVCVCVCATIYLKRNYLDECTLLCDVDRRAYYTDSGSFVYEMGERGVINFMMSPRPDRILSSPFTHRLLV